MSRNRLPRDQFRDETDMISPDSEPEETVNNRKSGRERKIRIRVETRAEAESKSVCCKFEYDLCPLVCWFHLPLSFRRNP